MAVTCDLDTELNQVNIADIFQIIPKSPQYDCCDAVLSRPIRILDLSTLQEALKSHLKRGQTNSDSNKLFNIPFHSITQLCRQAKKATEPQASEKQASQTNGTETFSIAGFYMENGKEPSLVHAYALKSLHRGERVTTSHSFRVADVAVVNLWTVVLWIERDSTRFKCSADLSKGVWTIEPARLCRSHDVTKKASSVQIVADVEESPVVETDEQGFYCSETAHQLPPVEFVSIGKHEEKCWGLEVAYG
eukprot:SAG31_NODE_6927_length_1847_cov_1.246568_1_plen_247_part_10